MWDLETGGVRFVLSVPIGTRAAISLDGASIVTIDGENLALWSVRDGKRLATRPLQAAAPFKLELADSTYAVLTRNGIVMDDAERGQVSHEPTVPGVQPREVKN